jgi:hypothetical protein
MLNEQFIGRKTFRAHITDVGLSVFIAWNILDSKHFYNAFPWILPVKLGGIVCVHYDKSTCRNRDFFIFKLFRVIGFSPIPNL